MNPISPDAGSPLATLDKLKEMLDAGTITQPEFEALKQRLIFNADPAGAAASLPEAPTTPPSGTPLEKPAAGVATPVAPVPSATTPPAAAPPTPYLDTPAALTPEAAPLLAPGPDRLAAPALLGPEPDDDEPTSPSEAAERRNPLNLIFALGGLLLFLAVVAYLVYDRRPDERMTSQSQTAADSAAVAPEVGPQAEQLTLPPAAAPETIRVAPVPAALPAAPDSAATQFGQTAAPVPAAATPQPAASARPAPGTKPTTTTTTDSTVGP